MEQKKIDQIIETLDQKSNESNAYIIEYLVQIINGIERLAPKQVNYILDAAIHNQQWRHETK